MAKALFVTGTGTDVGKTYISALVVKKLVEAEINAAYYKAAISGNIRDDQGMLIPGDAKWVKDIAGISQKLSDMCPYIYENAYSPHLASKLEGHPVEMSVIKEGFAALAGKYDYITMEGSGGIICPLRYDEKKIMLPDVIKELDLPCLIAADAGLGTINQVYLTVDYLRKKDIAIQGIIFNNCHADSIMEEDNFRMCEELTGVRTLDRIFCNDTGLHMSAEELLSIYREVKQ